MKDLLLKAKGAPRILRDIFLNKIACGRFDLFYVIENAPWSIAWDGRYLTESLNRQKLIKAKTVVDSVGLRNKIIHFGSESTFISNRGFAKVHPSNKKVFTWFHISPGDERVKFIPKLNQEVDIVHTSCNLTKDKLIAFGLSPEKIKVIPLGVDLSLFRKADDHEKEKIKQELKLPPQKIIIGSFQKDGQGWGEGNEPKLIKGPDIFLKTVEKINKKYPVHVLLTGPARGFVKNGIKKAGITYTHHYLKNYLAIARYYRSLDLYLMTSREEGGPKAILESMASGVPIVSTMAGMVPDILKDSQNAMTTAIGEPEQLAKKSLEVLDNDALKKRIINNALKDVRKYDWNNIAQAYYQKIYKKLLN